MKPEVITSTVTALCAIGGLITAMRGLRTWRHELRGRSEYELARRVMILVYKIRGGLEYVQQPYMSEAEWCDRPGRDASNEAMDEKAKDMRYAYNARLQSVIDARQALNIELLEAEAIWGDVLNSAAKKLNDVYAELAVMVMTYLDSRYNESESYSPDERRLIWKKMFNVGEDGAKFRAELTAAVQAFESVLRTHLRRS